MDGDDEVRRLCGALVFSHPVVGIVFVTSTYHDLTGILGPEDQDIYGELDLRLPLPVEVAIRQILKTIAPLNHQSDLWRTVAGSRAPPTGQAFPTFQDIVAPYFTDLGSRYLAPLAYSFRRVQIPLESYPSTHEYPDTEFPKFLAGHPSCLIIFGILNEDVDHVTRSIALLRSVMAERGVKVAAVLRVQAPAADEAENIMSSIRKSANLDARFTFGFPAQQSEEDTLIRRLTAFCAETSHLWYSLVEEQVKEERNGSLPEQRELRMYRTREIRREAISTMRPLLRRVWERFSYQKLPTRTWGRPPTAQTTQESVQIVDGAVQRTSFHIHSWRALRLYADILAWKLIAMTLASRDAAEAGHIFWKHIDRFVQPTSTCNDLNAMLKFDWLWRQYCQMAVAVSMGLSNKRIHFRRGFTHALGGPGDPNDPERGHGTGAPKSPTLKQKLQSIFGGARDATPLESRGAWHPGYLYLTSAAYTEHVRQKWTKLRDGGQLKNSPLYQSVFAAYDPSIASEKGGLKDCNTLLRPGVSPVCATLTLDLLTRSYELFKHPPFINDGSGPCSFRFNVTLAKEIARMYRLVGRWDLVSKYTGKIANSYRKDSWLMPLREVLEWKVEADTNIGNFCGLISCLTELSCVHELQAYRKSAKERLLHTLRSAVSSAKVVLPTAELHTFLKVSAHFTEPTSAVGLPANIQILVTLIEDEITIPISGLSVLLTSTDLNDYNERIELEASFRKVAENSTAALFSGNLSPGERPEQLDLCSAHVSAFDVEHLFLEPLDVEIVGVKLLSRFGSEGQVEVHWDVNLTKSLPVFKHLTNELTWCQLPCRSTGLDSRKLRVLAEDPRLDLRLKFTGPALLDEWGVVHILFSAGGQSPIHAYLSAKIGGTLEGQMQAIRIDSATLAGQGADQERSQADSEYFFKLPETHSKDGLACGFNTSQKPGDRILQVYIRYYSPREFQRPEVQELGNVVRDTDMPPGFLRRSESILIQVIEPFKVSFDLYSVVPHSSVQHGESDQGLMSMQSQDSDGRTCRSRTESYRLAASIQSNSPGPVILERCQWVPDDAPTSDTQLVVSSSRGEACELEFGETYGDMWITTVRGWTPFVMKGKVSARWRRTDSASLSQTSLFWIPGFKVFQEVLYCESILSPPHASPLSPFQLSYTFVNAQPAPCDVMIRMVTGHTPSRALVVETEGPKHHASSELMSPASCVDRASSSPVAVSMMESSKQSSSWSDEPGLGPPFAFQGFKQHEVTLPAFSRYSVQWTILPLRPGYHGLPSVVVEHDGIQRRPACEKHWRSMAGEDDEWGLVQQQQQQQQPQAPTTPSASSTCHVNHHPPAVTVEEGGRGIYMWVQ